MEHTLQFLKPLPATEAPYYPESDGKPMGETDFHITAMMYLLSALRYFFKNLTDVYVASDMLMYYEEGNTSVFVVPDVFVVKGVDKRTRRVYKVWEEKTAPTVIFEITSRGTRLEDLATKRGLYEILGVQEYFLFDPLDEYLSPRLRGFRLKDNAYQHLTLDSAGNLHSEALDVILHPDVKLLRVIDPTTNKVVPTLDEAMAMAEEEAERAQAEAERANNAEAELARLREEIKRLRGME